MNKYWMMGIIILILGVLVVSACGGSAPATTQAPAVPAGDATAGKAVFEQTCTTCHGADGKGKAGLGKDLVTSSFVKSQSDAELVAFITAGRPASDPANTTGVDMPAKGGNSSLTQQDMANAVAYIRTLQ